MASTSMNGSFASSPAHARPPFTSSFDAFIALSMRLAKTAHSSASGMSDSSGTTTFTLSGISSSAHCDTFEASSASMAGLSHKRTLRGARDCVAWASRSCAAWASLSARYSLSCLSWSDIAFCIVLARTTSRVSSSARFSCAASCCSSWRDRAMAMSLRSDTMRTLKRSMSYMTAAKPKRHAITMAMVESEKVQLPPIAKSMRTSWLAG